MWGKKTEKGTVQCKVRILEVVKRGILLGMIAEDDYTVFEFKRTFTCNNSRLDSTFWYDWYQGFSCKYKAAATT